MRQLFRSLLSRSIATMTGFAGISRKGAAVGSPPKRAAVGSSPKRTAVGKYGVILLATFALTSTAGMVGAAPSAGAPTPAPTASPGGAKLTATVHIRNFVFDPSSLTVHPGDAVLFVNEDDAPHTATAEDKSFDSGDLDTGASWRYTFRKAGTYTYFCSVHPFMKATILVTPVTDKDKAQHQ